MRKTLTFVLAAAFAAALSSTAPASGASWQPPNPAHLDASTITSFDTGTFGSFAEGLASDGNGNLFVTVDLWGEIYEDGTSEANVLQVYKVRPDGTTTEFGPAVTIGACAMATGLAVDPSGRVFVGLYNFSAGQVELCTQLDPANMPSGVLRVTSSGYSYAMHLPDGSVPNGVTAYDGHLYVADSAGAVWRGSTSQVTSPTTPWSSSGLLATEGGGFGANGIAYRAGAMYVTNSGEGTLVRIPFTDSGAAGRARVVARDEQLLRAGGLAFDAFGRAWIAVNPEVVYPEFTQIGDGAVVVVTPSGGVSVAHTPGGSLDYPTQTVVGADGSVLVTNGSYVYGTPSLVKLTS